MLKEVKKQHLSDYIFGYLSLEDERRVEAAIAQDPELEAEYLKVQEALAGFSGGFAKEPSSKVKDAIMAEIKADAAQSGVQPEAKVIEMKQPKAAKKAGGAGLLKGLAIAASFALLFSLGLNYFQYQEINKQKDLLAYLQSERSDLQSNLVSLSKESEQAIEELAHIKAFNNVQVTLNGTEKAPDAFAEIWWNPATKDIFLHKCNLPPAPESHTHQLWAIVDGKPVDMGIFNTSNEEVAGIQHMGVVKEASAFAITIEKEGGAVNPTLEEMIVIGEI